MNEKTNQETEKPAAKRRMRWWIPMTIVAFAVANVARIRGSAELDSNFKNMQAMLTIAVSILLLLVWFVFLTRLRWRTRLAGLGLFIVCVVGVKQSLRFDGSVDGSGTPRIVWKWTPRKTGNGVAFKTVNTPKEQPKLEAAFDCNDGTPAWRAGTDQASFSSPALATLGGRRQILSVNAASVSGHDPKDGRILWEYAWANKQWPKCAQPVVLEGDRVFLSASFNAGCVLLQLKAGADGNLSVAEVWKNRNMKSEFSNIVARDGFIYGLDDGILACVDIATGERKWKDGRYGHGQLILVDDLLLVQTEQGPIALVEVNPSTYREVARLNGLSAKTWNTPALAGEFLLVRNDQEAVCYRLPKRTSQASERASLEGN